MLDLTRFLAPCYDESIAYCGKHGFMHPQVANNVDIDRDRCLTTSTLSQSALVSYRSCNKLESRSYKRTFCGHPSQLAVNFELCSHSYRIMLISIEISGETRLATLPQVPNYDNNDRSWK